LGIKDYELVYRLVIDITKDSIGEVKVYSHLNNESDLSKFNEYFLYPRE
jgi:hypothetical protein